MYRKEVKRKNEYPEYHACRIVPKSGNTESASALLGQLYSIACVAFPFFLFLFFFF